MNFIVNKQNLKNVKLNYDNLTATEYQFTDTFEILQKLIRL